jgi:MFS transporter, OFA family, oxalate/formate antiporter
LTAPQFWLMWGMIVFSASAGLNVASTYKQFAASSTALTGDSFQALVGGLGALFNGVGRLFWGQISDSIGFKKSFMGLTLFQAVLHAYYPYTADSKVAYAAATCMCYFFLAGNFALMPPAIQKMFGPKNGALIYGLVYSAFGVASIGGMILGKGLKAQFGLEGVFRALSVMSVFGALLTSRLQPLRSLPSSTV